MTIPFHALVSEIAVNRIRWNHTLTKHEIFLYVLLLNDHSNIVEMPKSRRIQRFFRRTFLWLETVCNRQH
jgi:hypothetical protein